MCVWLASQAFINMGVNMGVLPTKGLTLPLLSFGGTGIVVNCTALAMTESSGLASCSISHCAST